MDQSTKACPFCGEQVLAVAIKCKHCGSKIPRTGNEATPGAEPSASAKTTVVAGKAKYVGLAVVLLGIISGCAWFMLRPRPLPSGIRSVKLGMTVSEAEAAAGPATDRRNWADSFGTNSVFWKGSAEPYHVEAREDPRTKRIVGIEWTYHCPCREVVDDAIRKHGRPKKYYRADPLALGTRGSYTWEEGPRSLYVQEELSDSGTCFCSFALRDESLRAK